MPDNLKIKQPADAKKVNVHEKWEVDYWCNKWKVTPSDLQNAVRRVGVKSDDVARALGKA